MKDAIVDELKERREDYVKRFNYDFGLIAEDLKKKQEELKGQGYKFVKLQPKFHRKNEAAQGKSSSARGLS